MASVALPSDQNQSVLFARPTSHWLPQGVNCVAPAAGPKFTASVRPGMSVPVVPNPGLFPLLMPMGVVAVSPTNCTWNRNRSKLTARAVRNTLSTWVWYSRLCRYASSSASPSVTSFSSG